MGSIDKVTTDRICGSGRVETAVKVSQSVYPKGTKAAILANGEKFSNVLTAMPYGKIILDILSKHTM